MPSNDFFHTLLGTCLELIIVIEFCSIAKIVIFFFGASAPDEQPFVCLGAEGIVMRRPHHPGWMQLLKAD